VTNNVRVRGCNCAGLLVPCSFRLLSCTITSPRETLRQMRSLLFRMVWLVVCIAPAMAAQPAAAPVLPTVSFSSLSKDRVTLPADLHSDRNLLVLYFDLMQQPDVDGWNTIIDRWRATDPSLTSYVSLVSPQKNFLSRWWQNASMRSASADASRWPTTVPLYVDKKDFERTLDISTEKQVVLLLTDRKGHILSRVAGPPTDTSRSAMRVALVSAGSPVSAEPAAGGAIPQH
jgi:hypothetical protein